VNRTHELSSNIRELPLPTLDLNFREVFFIDHAYIFVNCP